MSKSHNPNVMLQKCRAPEMLLLYRPLFEVNVWSSTVYSCDFHEGRHFITLLMFVLNFVLFFNLFTLVIFMKVDNISSHC